MELLKFFALVLLLLVLVRYVRKHQTKRKHSNLYYILAILALGISCFAALMTITIPGAKPATPLLVIVIAIPALIIFALAPIVAGLSFLKTTTDLRSSNQKKEATISNLHQVAFSYAFSLVIDAGIVGSIFYLLSELGLLGVWDNETWHRFAGHIAFSVVSMRIASYILFKRTPGEIIIKTPRIQTQRRLLCIFLEIIISLAIFMCTRALLPPA